MSLSEKSKLSDPRETLRLEPALRLLARNKGQLSVAYVARRHCIAKEDIEAWLLQFNGNRKDISDARIEAVKRDLGLIKEQSDSQQEPAPERPEEEEPALVLGHDAQQRMMHIAAHPLGFTGSAILATRQSWVVNVTPELAASWLERNSANRNPSKAKIRRFVAAMRKGLWTVNGETVKFSVGGRLLDGQSRLKAVVEANMAVALEVIADLPDAAQASMDMGETRRGAHMLEMMGEKQPNTLAASLRMVLLWEQRRLSGEKWGDTVVLQNPEIPELLARHNALKASVGFVYSSEGKGVQLLLPGSEAAFFHYVFGLADPALRDRFFEQLIEGVGLTKTSPVRHLREVLIRDKNAEARRAKRSRWALVIMAWNLARAGSSCDELEHKKGAKFPEIDGAIYKAA